MYKFSLIFLHRLSQGSNSQLNEEKASAKKKSPITLWGEWSDQDIANEKWVCYLLFELVAQIFISKTTI